MGSYMSRLKSRFVSAMEAGAVLYFIWMLTGGDLFGFPVLFLLLRTRFAFLPIDYSAWMYWDRLTPFRGGRQVGFVRRLFIWNYLRDYFPIKLHKTVDLDPTKNYMFCFHPHGVLCVSSFINFATEATGFSRLFPGITPHLLTLEVFFYMPLFREYAMACGLTSVRQDSINYKLTKIGQGHSVLIVAGGVAEANLTPETSEDNPYQVKIKGRHGFIREALKAGSPVVPVLSFGESEVLYQVKAAPDSLLKKWQDISHRIFRFAPMMFRSTGSSSMPFRRPIDTVVGSPLEIPQISNPTDEEINYWHAQYVEALKKLFTENKERFASPNKDIEVL